MGIKVYLIKSFTKDKSQGNPTGIVLDADKLTDQQMLRIAKELNFSESAFIQLSEKATYKTRFFAPEKEVGLCGHATIATFHLLVKTGRLKFDSKKELSITQETLVGILPVTGYNDGLIVMTQRKPDFFELETDKKLVALLLGITPTDILDGPIQTVSTGTPKLIVPVISLKALMKIKPDLEEIKDYCRRTEAKGIYPYTTETIEKSSDFHARQFNPLADINEDAVTGVAAGALGSYIKQYKLSKKTKFIIEQGYNMGMPGKMYVDVSKEVKVGGYAVTYGERMINL